MDALILFSHGSLLCGAGEALDRHAARLRETGRWPIVEVGYLNYSEPAFPAAVAKCAAAGATRIVIVPFFLVPGYFVTTALTEQLNLVQPDYPNLTFAAAEAIGYHPHLAGAILESAEQAAGPGDWRGDLTAASRNCRALPDCPLYATPNCPRVPTSLGKVEFAVE